ncbi:MAG: cobalamin-dependent protein, partial [Planctomycetes bacterium]|nr:cobalamin-dependent protein [Planctomycetota bacterium]
MKVLVVNANNELRPNPVVPLGACLAASAAEAAGHETSFLDLAFEKDPTAALRRAIDRVRPEAIGVSLRNVDNTDFSNPRFYLGEVREAVVRPALEALPGRVVLGGAGFSTMPEEILEYTGAPAGVVADGEIAFPALLARWAEGRGAEGVEGVVRLEGGRAAGDPRPAAPRDLDALPRSRAWKWLDLGLYRSFGGVSNLQTKRG